MTNQGRPYHHGHLRQAVIDAAVAEVAAVGASALSMRGVARRAGVSHAAPAHHFGDKIGIFTAIAIEGFEQMTQAIEPVAFGEDGFIDGGQAYVLFAIGHPGHFEVMFRPALHNSDDPRLAEVSGRAFEVLRESARHAIELQGSGEDPDDLALAGWSYAHGIATLWLQSDLSDRVAADPLEQLSRGAVLMGELTRRARERRS